MKQSFTLENELQEKVEKITEVDYGKDIDLETIEEMIKDLIYEYHCLEEKLEDQETHCRQWHETRKDIVDDYYYETWRDNNL